MDVNVSLTVNGKKVTGKAEPRTLLVQFLRETLAARGAILSRFENLPRPRTRAEIAQLEGMNARYRRLIQTLREIRLVLDQVLERGPEPRP